MVKVYYDKDANLSILKDEKIAIIGYGNQGRAQALNMRDSGLDVIIGNIKDAYWDKAIEDGFDVYPISEAAKEGTIIFLLVPDEIQPMVYEENIKPNLAREDALVFAHGYNIHYGFIIPPRNIDVLLLAPRMIGASVRSLFKKGSGAPAFISVYQDVSGKAKERVLALAKAIGATRVGAMEISFAEETELDHFSEHFLWPVILRAIQLSFEVLVAEGYTAEAIVLEQWASGEASEVFKEAAIRGIFKQLSLHSTTSQYGQLLYGSYILPEKETKKRIRKIIKEIKDGSFARKWMMERKRGYPVFRKLKERALRHPINEAERRLKEKVKIFLS
jgi:ketol-acid reductoisomerase